MRKELKSMASLLWGKEVKSIVGKGSEYLGGKGIELVTSGDGRLIDIIN